MVSVAAAVLLSGCGLDGRTDLHGYDPVEYYEENPIKNSIEIKNQSVRVNFVPGKNRLTPGEVERLRDNLHRISMPSVESVQVGLTKADVGNTARKEHIAKIMRHLGYTKGNFMYEPLSTLKPGEMQLDVTYAVVVLPDCPDWRRSSVTSHSNTEQANFHCAGEVNLGLMVADPHDLVRGSGGEVPIDTQRSSKVLQDYRGAQSTSVSSPLSASGGASESSASAPSEASSDGAQ